MTSTKRPKRIDPRDGPDNPEWVERAFDQPFTEAELSVVAAGSTDEPAEGAYLFHLPGKHAQKRHGYRSVGGVKSVKSKSGEWKPVKYDKGKKTAAAGTKPAPKPKETPKSRGQQKREQIAAIGKQFGYVDPKEADKQIKALEGEIQSVFKDPSLSSSEKLARMKPFQDERSSLLQGKASNTLAVAEMRGALYADDPIGPVKVTMITNKQTIAVGKKPQPEHLSGAAFVGSVVDKGAMKGYMSGQPEVGVALRKGVRANALPGRMTLDPADGPEVFAHEMGHVLEYANPAMRQRSIEWREERTKGEASVSLAKATGNPSYSSSEVTKVDKFSHPYIGKDYGTKASEVVSMGLQFLYNDPLKFATKDPEMFDFIIEQVQPGGGA